VRAGALRDPEALIRLSASQGSNERRLLDLFLAPIHQSMGLLAVAARKARETMRLCEIVGLVGYALGGLPGERLPDRLGIKSSDDTVLRRVKARRRGANQPAVRAER
jgi:hypothetical protein